MRVQLAWYKGKGRLLDRLIRLVDGQPYSHCEFGFGGDLYFSADAWTDSVRFFRGRLNPDNWDFQEIEVTGEQWNRAISYANAANGCKYDWRGALRFLLPFLSGSNERYFCSEICCLLLQEMGLLPGARAANLTPNGLFKLCKNLPPLEGK